MKPAHGNGALEHEPAMTVSQETEKSEKPGAGAQSDIVVIDYGLGNLRSVTKALEAVGVIETKDAIAAVHAADAAAKAARIHLLEVRAVAPGGKGFVTLNGEVGAVRTAVAAGIEVVPEGALVSHIVIPMAHEQLVGSLAK